jgi:hypothetical protein
VAKIVVGGANEAIHAVLEQALVVTELEVHSLLPTQKAKFFFFEKKKQKTFVRLGARQITKVFLLLFLQKKKAFLLQNPSTILAMIFRWISLDPP